MKKINKNDLKIIIFFILSWVLILLIYFGISVIKDNKASENSFRSYNYHNITENYNDISKMRILLMNDQYFLKLAIFDEYNNSLEDKNMKKSFLYYLSYLNKSNTRALKIDNNYEKLCMSKKIFKKSIEELFYEKNENYFERLNTISFINYDGKNICFSLDVLQELDYIHYIGIKDMNVVGDIITCNIYFYSIYTNEEETTGIIENSLYNNLQSNTLDNFNNIFKTQYGGIIEEKTIKFKENPKGKYFKYTLVSISTKY